MKMKAAAAAKIEETASAAVASAGNRAWLKKRKRQLKIA